MNGPKRTNRDRIGDHFSLGAAQLWATGLSSPDIARSVEVDTSVVLRWLYGDVLPSRKGASACFDRFGIDPRAWDEPPPADFILPRLNGAHRSADAQSGADVQEAPRTDDTGPRTIVDVDATGTDGRG